MHAGNSRTGFFGGPVHSHETFGFGGVGRRSVSAGGEDCGRRRQLLRLIVELLRLIVAHFPVFGVCMISGPQFRRQAGQSTTPGFVQAAADGMSWRTRPLARSMSADRAITARHSRYGLCLARHLQTAFSGCTSRHLAETPDNSAADRQSGSRSRIHPEIRFAVSSAFLGVSSHSHTTAKRHPADVSASSASLSRSTFRSNFGIQYSRFDLGVVALEHPSCRCQKQP